MFIKTPNIKVGSFVSVPDPKPNKTGFGDTWKKSFVGKVIKIDTDNDECFVEDVNDTNYFNVYCIETERVIVVD